MAVPTAGGAARIAWFEQAGSQTDRNRPAPTLELPAPGWATASGGRGQVTVDWQPVDGAAGYLVHRAASGDGPFVVIDHGGGDVLAVPGPPYTDTTGERDVGAWYAVGAIATIETPTGPLSPPVLATPSSTGAAAVAVQVSAADVAGPLQRPWRPVIGSEHLALLLRGVGPGGRHVGDELAEAFGIVRHELGVESVRAHAILDDSLGVYRERDGRAVHEFGRVDAALDRLLQTGLRPLVELSFVPRALASDPDRTVFDYRAPISPPRDEARWTNLVGDLVDHLVARHGVDAVGDWPFEVWNEPNLQVFWTADEAAYLRLYETTVRAVRGVDSRLRVGGPATAAAGWVDDLLAFAADGNVPLDFLSTHTYGAPPLDLRPIAARFGRPDIPLFWTEWGVSPTHSSPVNDSVWGAPLVARGMRSAAGRVAALAYWVASDHFVELGEAERLFHGGFGLLTIGNLRKPRYWAIAMLERLGADELHSTVEGDGAGSLVEAWASRDPDGRVAIALWNGTLDQSKAAGDALLDRTISLTVDNLDGPVEVRHRRVDASHSNIGRTWQELGDRDWPDDAGWEALHAADRLADLEPSVRHAAARGRVELEFELPMPAVSLVELTLAR